MAFHEMEVKQLELPCHRDLASLDAGAPAEGREQEQAEVSSAGILSRPFCAHEEVINHNSLYLPCRLCSGGSLEMGMFLLPAISRGSKETCFQTSRKVIPFFS